MEYYFKSTTKAVQVIKPIPYKELFDIGCKSIGQMFDSDGKEYVLVDGRSVNYGDYVYNSPECFSPGIRSKSDFEENTMPKDLVDKALEQYSLSCYKIQK